MYAWIKNCRGQRVALSALSLVAVTGFSANAAEPPAEPVGADALMELSLEELMGLEVTTFSRRPQLLSDTPAATFVISSYDIEHSGARTLPDVLRMAPGLQVAQVDSSTWAVTARGSNGVFANKLLVLQDGRSIYSPLYSGVYWDMRDVDLDSIERIEVIRGPGATMWGSNAVNGVINIITKNSADTQGVSLDAVAGTERLEGVASYSGEAGATSYRAYGKWFDRDGYIGSADGSAPDDWDMLRAGLRVDWEANASNTITFNGDVFSGSIGENTLETDIVPPYNNVVAKDRDVSGGFAMVSWDYSHSDTSQFQLRTYYDRTKIENIAPEEVRDTFDVEIQQLYSGWANNNIIWGLGYRGSKDETTGSFVISLLPDSRTQHIYSGFVQDEISLSDDLALVVGVKVEKNSFSTNSLEWEPNVRMRWNFTDTQMVWASVARAVRTPSRVEQNGTINGAVLPPGVPLPGPPPVTIYPVPTVFTIEGNPDLETEEVIAYEMGWRGNPADQLNLDVSLFYNQYDGLRVTSAPQAPVCQPGDIPVFIDPTCPNTAGYVSLPVMMLNGDDVDTWGAEFNASYKATESWWLQGAYSYLKVDGANNTAVSSVGQDSPEHQVSARSLWNMTDDLQLDLWLRYVDELEAQEIPSYVTMDARFNWIVSTNLQVALVGRNLLEDGHTEFREEFGASVAVDIPREAYLELKWNY